MITTSIESINQQSTNLIHLRNQIALMTEQLDSLKSERDIMQQALISSMKSSNLKSWKTNDFSFSLVSKFDTRITNEEELIQDLKKRKLTDLISERVDTARIKQLSNLLLKETGELFFGTESVHIEYLSIRSVS